MDETSVYAWLRVVSPNDTVAESEAPRLVGSFSDLAAQKLAESNISCETVVPCVRTGSATEPPDAWRWWTSWSKEMDDAQLLSPADRMMSNRHFPVLVLISSTALTVNPAAMLQVLAPLVGRDGLVVTIEQDESASAVSAREVEGGLKVFADFSLDFVAPAERPCHEQVSSCLSAVEELRNVSEEVMCSPGVRLAHRMVVAFLAGRPGASCPVEVGSINVAGRDVRRDTVDTSLRQDIRL